MKIKNLQFVILLLLIFLGVKNSIAQTTFTVNGLNYQVNEDEYTVTVTGPEAGTAVTGEVNIPSVVYYSGRTYTVTIIGYQAFRDCTGLTSIEIPSSVTKIEYNAFYYCNNLISIKCMALTPPSLEEDVFGYVPCDVLEVKGNSISAYCNSAWGSWFSNIVGEGNVSLFTVDNFIYSALSGRYNATIMGRVDNNIIINDVTLPSTVEYDGHEYTVDAITRWAFYNHKDLRGILTLPNTLRKIGQGAFSQCNRFTSFVSLASTPPELGRDAFNATSYSNALQVNTVNIEAYKASDWHKCFYIITSIGNLIEFIDGDMICVKAVDGNWALIKGHVDGTSATGTLTIPSTVICNGISYPVKVIGKYAFYGCNHFTGDIVVPEGVEIVGSTAFYGMNGIQGNIIIPNTVTRIDDWAFSWNRYATGSLVIPNSVTEIGFRAFYLCELLNGTLTLSNSLTEMGEHAFEGCGYLTGTVTIPNTIRELKERVFNRCRSLTAVVIPNSVEIIASEAFSSCGFTELVIPESVREIGPWAFSSCANITGDLVIPNSVIKIGEGAFANCSGYEGALTIGSSVTEIGKNAFGSCNFTSVKTLAKNPPSLAVDDWYTDVFDNVPATILKVPCESKPLYDASDWHNHFTKIIRDCFAVESVETNISTIYPNPTTGVMKINAENLKSVEIYNTMGQKVFEAEASGDDFEYDFQGATGMYLVRVKTSQGIETRKITVM